MATAMPPIPGAQQAEPMPDLSGLAGQGGPPQPAASAQPDQAMQFMQLVRQLDELAASIASANPKFSKAADAIKKAIQQGTVDVIAEQKESQSTSPAAGMAYAG